MGFYQFELNCEVKVFLNICRRKMKIVQLNENKIKFTFYLFNVQFTGIKHIHIVVQPLPTIHLELFHFPKQKLWTVSGYARSARKKPFPALTRTLHSHLCLSWSSLYQEKFDWFPLGRKCVCVFIQNTLVAWLPFVSWVA